MKPLAIAKRSFWPILVMLAAAVPLAQAQTSSTPKVYVLNRVTVAGARRFSTEQIVSASGLKKGQQLDMAAVDAAADRLFKTGAIAKIGYSFRTVGTALDVEFQVTEASQFLPCTYDNFVWFKDADLTAAVQREVPLFDGSLPVGGEIVNQVPAAMEKILQERKVNGKVIVTMSGELGEKPSRYVLRVTDVAIPVTAIDIAGGPLPPEALAEAEAPLLSQSFSRTIARGAAEKGLPEAYQNEGYLQAKFSEPQVTMKDPQGADASQGVIVKYIATPGPLYNWNGATWTGNQAMHEPDLTQLLQLKVGDVAQRVKMLRSWVDIQRGYGKLGYLDARLSPAPEFDPAQHQVHFQVKVDEGAQYMMGQFTVTGVSEPLATKLKQVWNLRPGQAYDVSYKMTAWPKDMGGIAASGVAIRGQYTINESVNRQTHIVDVELQVR